MAAPLGLEITELRLGLPGGCAGRYEKKKRVFSSVHGGGRKVDFSGENGGGGGKNRNIDVVVGWPPVKARKMYVKVSMDGAPILRKIDLSFYKGYYDLGMALEKLFDCHGIGEAMKDESESCEYIIIHEDKDGDWMLVGDVPWQMFTETCKRLRIKKRSDEINGIGLHACN